MIRLTDDLTPLLDSRLYKICILIARLGLAYLFFTQLFWKLPPRFGCGSEFNFPVAAEENYFDSNGSSGLCYWMGLESIYASQPRQVLIADMRSAGLPTISLNITPLAQLNALVLDQFFIPNIRFTGWLVWLAEFAIVVSMLFGLFTRLGALISIGVATQLYIGLANIPRPFEWEWSYGTIILLSIALLGAASGRFFGVDGRLRKRLAGAAAEGKWYARAAILLT